MKFGTDDFSVSAWAQTTSASGEEVVVGANRCTIGEAWLLSFGSGKVGFATFGTGSTGGYVQSPSTYNDGNWHFLAATRKGTNLTLYVDGSAVAGGTVSSTYNSDSGGSLLTIGNLNGCTGREFSGSIDSVRLFPRALSAAELAALP
jgi:hypothetical protein